MIPANQWPDLPPRAQDLTGARFGRLVVRHYAGKNRYRHTTWCCECDCGNFVQVESGALLGHKGNGGETKSCGCLRSDPGIRLAARLKVPAAKRKQICAKMRKAVKQRKPAYSMSLDRAAELMSVTPDRLRTLCHDGTIGSRLKGGRLWVSSQQVGDYIAEVARCEKRKCMTRDKAMRRAMISSIKSGQPWPQEHCK